LDEDRLVRQVISHRRPILVLCYTRHHRVGSRAFHSCGRSRTRGDEHYYKADITEPNVLATLQPGVSVERWHVKHPLGGRPEGQIQGILRMRWGKKNCTCKVVK
jgi:hypothetical protein